MEGRVSDIKAITNVQIALEDEIISNGSVLIEDGMIVNIFPKSLNPEHAGYEVMDGRGGLLIPGMIDIHIHGANGYDMMDGSVKSIDEVSRACIQGGVTSFLATSVSSSIEDLLLMIENVKKSFGNEPGAKIVGIHLEGPYLNKARKGMQHENYLRHPDIEEMKLILGKGRELIKMVTLAPELPGGLELITFLHEKNIIPAIAHSDANYEEAKSAFKLGAHHITHCFNGMRPVHHRDPGLVVAALEDEKVSVQVIVDHIHLHPAIVKLLYKIKGPDRMILITDAMQALGLGDGIYKFGGHRVTVSKGVAKLDNGSLASSTISMNHSIKKAIRSGITILDAITMATKTPADLLALNKKGRISEGADADLVLLTTELDVSWSMVAGNIVYKSPIMNEKEW